MIRRVWSQLVDEVAGLVLLHGFFQYRGLPPVAGQTLGAFPDLFSGELDRFYRPHPDPVDLNRDRRRVAQTSDCTVSDLAFASAVQTPFDATNRVLVRLWEPRHDRGLTVVGVDGIVQVGCRWFTRLAERLTPHGVSVAMMDAPFNYRRTPVGYRPGQLIVGGDLDHQLAVTRQAALDLWTLIESLQADGRRVGLVGCSYGGWLVLIAALLAERLDFTIALAPPVNIVRLLERRGAVVRAVRSGLRPELLDPDHVAHVARVVTPHFWQPRVAPQAITLHAARYDRIVSTECIVDLAERWGARLVMHDDAHYGATSRPQIISQVAGQVLEYWENASSPA